MVKLDIAKAGEATAKLVAALERGEVDEVVIEREGRAVARLSAIRPAGPRRLGFLDGKVPSLDLDAFNAADPEVHALFGAAR